MSRFTARSVSTVSLLSAAILGSALLAPAAIAAPVSAGNSFEIPVASHTLTMRAVAHRTTQHRVRAGNSFEIPLLTSGSARIRGHMTGWQPFSAGNSFEIPVDGRLL